MAAIRGRRSPLSVNIAAVVLVVVATTIAMGQVVAETVLGGGRSRHEGNIRAAWAGSSRADTAFPLSHLHFCLGCPDPGAEGSLGERFQLSTSAFDLRFEKILCNTEYPPPPCSSIHMISFVFSSTRCQISEGSGSSFQMSNGMPVARKVF